MESQTRNSLTPSERIGAIPEAVWAPVMSFILLAIVGGFALAAGQPWIFPSLGPTAHLQTAQARRSTAQLYHVIVGHALGIGSGYGAVYLLGANTAPAILSTYHVTTVRVFAATLAVFLTLLTGTLLKASHPPAAATTLIIALGGFKGWKGVSALAAGIVILALLGDAARRVRANGLDSLDARERVRRRRAAAAPPDEPPDRA